MSDEPNPQGPNDSPGSGDAGNSDDPFGRAIDKRIDEALRVRAGGRPDPPPLSPLQRFSRRQRGEAGKWRGVRMWSVLFALLAVIIVLAVIFGMQDDLSCADEDSTTADSQAAQTSGSASEQNDGAPEEQGSTLYDRARAALGLSENTATSRSGAASPELTYYFRWVDANGAVQSDIGTVKLIDDSRGVGGHAYVYGWDDEPSGEGAYQIVTNPLGIELALWIPPPAGYQSELIILHMTDTGSRSLTGWAERDANGKRTKLEYGVKAELITGK